MKTTIELVPGLPKKELVERIHFHQRQGEVADRALGFYLLDMQRRKEYRPFKDASQWARKHLGACHRVDKLMLLAKRLEELPQIEAAFDQGEVPWTKIRAVFSPLDPPEGTVPASPGRTPSRCGSRWPARRHRASSRRRSGGRSVGTGREKASRRGGRSTWRGSSCRPSRR